MGWKNCHLHQFAIGEDRFVDPRFLEDGMMDWARSYAGFTIAKLVAKYGANLKMRYDYDFGDGWEHKIVLEKVVAPKSTVSYIRVAQPARTLAHPRTLAASGATTIISKRSAILNMPSMMSTLNGMDHSMLPISTRQKPRCLCKQDCRRGNGSVQQPAFTQRRFEHVERWVGFGDLLGTVVG